MKRSGLEKRGPENDTSISKETPKRVRCVTGDHRPIND
jgi:hypothetical protein